MLPAVWPAWTARTAWLCTQQHVCGRRRGTRCSDSGAQQHSPLRSLFCAWRVAAAQHGGRTPNMRTDAMLRQSCLVLYGARLLAVVSLHPRAQVYCSDGTEDSRYPHPFELRVSVKLHGADTLEQRLMVRNTGTWHTHTQRTHCVLWLSPFSTSGVSGPRQAGCHTVQQHHHQREQQGVMQLLECDCDAPPTNHVTSCLLTRLPR